MFCEKTYLAKLGLGNYIITSVLQFFGFADYRNPVMEHQHQGLF